MDVGLLCSCCETSSRNMMSLSSSSSSQLIRSCGATGVTARRNSSSTACCSSFSSCVAPQTSPSWSSGATLVREARQRHRDERRNASVSSLATGVNLNRELRGHGLDQWRDHGKSRQLRRGPIAPRSRGGGASLPGNRGGGGNPRNSYISPPGLGQFRPPSTAYVPDYIESEEEKQHAAIRKKVLVEKLRDGHGSWQERAAFITEVQQLGVTSEDLYTLTFVPIVKQLEIVVAGQVYESLVHSGTSPEILQRFDEFSLGLLYALRTLSGGQRRAAAEYVMENSLSIEEAQKLGWAIKDHERRPLGRKGFTVAPGDCLAFMYHRQAIETQDEEERKAVVELGLKVAVTDSAKQRFSEFS